MAEIIAQNISMGVASIASQEFTSWFSLVVIIGLCSVVLSLLLMAIHSAKGYARLRRILNLLGDSFNNFLVGLATLIALSVPGSMIYYFTKQAAEGNTAPLWMTLVIVGGYFIIALIGLGTKKLLKRFKYFEAQLKKEVKNKKN